MMEAHEVFGDASRKAHLQPQRLTLTELARLEQIAAEGIDPDDEDESCASA